MFEVIRKLNFVVLGVLCKTNIQASTVASFLIEIDGPESQRQRLAQDLPLTFRPIFRPQRIFKKNSNFFLDIVNLVYYIDSQLNILFIAILDPVFLVQFLLFKSVHFFNFAQKGILLFNSPLRVRGGFSSLDSISCRIQGKVSTSVSYLPHCTIHRVLECRTYLPHTCCFGSVKIPFVLWTQPTRASLVSNIVQQLQSSHCNVHIYKRMVYNCTRHFWRGNPTHQENILFGADCDM